jgi:ferrous iron transport protein A
MESRMTLDQISVGDDFVISAVSASGEIRRRLVDMGFVSGTRGTLLRKALLGDPIEVSLGAYRIAVRRAEAQRIQVAHADGRP